MTNLHIHSRDPSVDGSAIDNPAATTTHAVEHATHSHPVDGDTLRYVKRSALLLLILFVVAIGVRAIVNYRNAEALKTHNSASLQRTVLTAHAVAGELLNTVSLPTTLRGGNETSIYARSNGYLTAWHKGIGDVVKKGELLATIDAPEQEQELAQLKAARQQIFARLDFSRLTLKRWESLRQRDGVSQQELEEKRSAVVQSEADLAAADANVKRVEQLEGFRRIVAPFNGVITRRGVEVGDLVSANGKELFALTQTDPLRVSIWIPQVYASEIKIGQHVDITASGTGRTFSAVIERVAGGIDTQTRSRQVDLVLANADAALLPGAYAEATLKLSRADPNIGRNALVVPSSVLMTNEDGFRVAIVDNNRIAFRPVKIGRDLGREIEVLSGIDANDTLVVSPSDLLVDNEAVTTQPWKEKTKGGGKDKAADKAKGSEKSEKTNTAAGKS